MEGEDGIYKTAMELLDSVEKDFDTEEWKIIECGIVVILENEDVVTARTRSSTDRYHTKRGMWEWAVDTIKTGKPVE